MAQHAAVVWLVRTCRAVDDECIDASAGGDLHSWIERTTECMNTARSDMEVVTLLGVWREMYDGGHAVTCHF